MQYSNPHFDVKVVNFEDHSASWTKRLANTVRHAQSDQILFMLDDFFITDRVDTQRVMRCVQWLKNNANIATFTFWSLGRDTTDCPYPGFGKRPRFGRYTVPGIAGVWNKEKLLWYLSGDESAWEWEVNATKRSYQTNDEFYDVNFGITTKIIPYDFAFYGLVGGKWTKGTVDLFEKNQIDMDFSIRGFHDSRLMALAPSFIAGMKLDSQIVPYYALTHDGDPTILCDTVTEDCGQFKQTYILPGARKLICWEPTSVHGSAVGNLRATFSFADGSTEIVDERQVFGNCVLLDGLIVFKTVKPTVYIPVQNNSLIEMLTIEGEFIKPLSEDVLLAVGEMQTIPTPPEQALFETGIWRETLLANRQDSLVLIKPQITIDSEKKLWAGPFSITYPLSEDPGATICWIPSNQKYFSIEDFSVKVKAANGYTHKLEYFSKQESFCQIQNHTVFAHASQKVFFSLPEFETSELILSGILHSPMPREILRYLCYGHATDDEIRAIEIEQSLAAVKQSELDSKSSIEKGIKKALKAHGLRDTLKAVLRRVVRR